MIHGCVFKLVLPTSFTYNSTYLKRFRILRKWRRLEFCQHQKNRKNSRFCRRNRSGRFFDDFRGRFQLLQEVVVQLGVPDEEDSGGQRVFLREFVFRSFHAEYASHQSAEEQSGGISLLKKLK